MPRSVAIQMDPIAAVNIEADSTFVLILEAQHRGYDLYFYTPQDMSLENGEVYASLSPLKVRNTQGDHYTLGEPQRRLLKEMDVILLRQDPPFNMHYITTTHYLELVMSDVLVVNNPVEVRNCPEKLFVCQFPELMPATLITEDVAEIKQFWAQHKDIIIKPLYAHGGADVFHLREGDRNLQPLAEMFMGKYNCPLIAQQFLPGVVKGDKRIILVDGEPIGAVNRVPEAGEIRSNMVVGGTPEKSTLTKRDKEICAAIGSELRKRGLLLVGIDVIGEYLTEINVTSPTGLQAINRLDNICTEAMVWDAIEGKL